MKIKILRHSERYDYKYPHRWIFYLGHYWADTHLTYEGRKMAASKAKAIKNSPFNAKWVYTSPYIRTMETAVEIKNVFNNCQLVIEPLLSEYQPYWRHNVSLYPCGIPTSHRGEPTEFNFPETKEQHRKRIEYILNAIISNHKNDDELIIVTHAEVVRTACELLNTKFPDLLLDATVLPYLGELSFEYDKSTDTFVEKSIITNFDNCDVKTI